jgi:DNA gyrase subunit A
MRTIPMARDLAESYFGYAMYTILHRAVPDVRDGLKPVQRRILYAMHDMGLRSTTPHKKSARVVGDVLGKWHPHGDQAVYDAMVRMAQDFTLRCPLVDGQGNWGSVDGDSAAAMRYTEARMAPVAETMLQDISRNTVDFIPNFDGSLQEPTLLPTAFPNLLVNGSSGIAVGMSTNIPPHNLEEVCDAIVLLIDRWRKRTGITADDLLEVVKGPDFPTGGIIYRKNSDDQDTIRLAYETGQGHIAVQGKLDVEDIGGGKQNIIVKELPYQIKKTSFIERIGQCVRDGKITGITDLRDESDSEGMRVVVEVSRMSTAEEVLEGLLKHTPLRGTFGVTLLALVPNPEYDGSGDTGDEDAMMASRVMPKYLTLKEVLVYFVKHRLEVITRRSRHELAEKEKRLHVVEGLLVALDNIDEVIATIKKSRTQETAKRNLRKRFQLSEVQARAILDMPLRRLAALEQKKLQDEGKELRKRISYLKALLRSQAKRLGVVKEETLAIKEQFATPRRTLILEKAGERGLAELRSVDVEGDQVITVSTKGNISRVSAAEFNGKQTKGTSKRAVEAPLFWQQVGATDTALLVSSAGRAWRGSVGQIPLKGTPGDLELSKEETIVGAGAIPLTGPVLSVAEGPVLSVAEGPVLSVAEGPVLSVAEGPVLSVAEGPVLSAAEGFLTLVATNGKVKRTALSDLAGAEGHWNTVMGGLGKGDRIIVAGVTDGNAEVMIFTEGAKAIRFKETVVNPQASGSATGVAAIKLGKGDTIIAGALVTDPRAYVVIVSENGWLKRVPLKDFSVQGRGGGGVQTLKITKATGKVAGAAVSSETGSVNVMSVRGRRCHRPTKDIPVSNRPNRGEQLVDFDGEAIEGVYAFER